MPISNFLDKGARAPYRLITFIYKITHGCWNIFGSYSQHMLTVHLQNIFYKIDRTPHKIAGVMAKKAYSYRNFWNFQPNSILFLNDQKHLRMI